MIFLLFAIWEFKYDDIRVNVIEENNEINAEVSFNLINIGNIKGSEIAQLYVNDVESSLNRPKLELKGFEKVSLLPGESKKITINLDKKSFAFYSEDEKSWIVEPGEFNILVGSSCININLEERINIKSKYKF